MFQLNGRARPGTGPVFSISSGLSRALIMLLALLAGASASLCGEDAADEGTRDPELKHLRNIRQLTFVGSKNGEAYFSPDGQQIIFQGVRQADNPFYQIYRLNLARGETVRVSPGTGRTTCAYFHPKKQRVLFASSHLDPDSQKKQKEELEKLRTAPPKRYAWDFDPFFDIFESDPDGSNAVRLTNTEGYDAEGSYSPDGTQIVFCSRRDGDEEIYVMDSDGKNPRRLTNEKGYDGGPFFSPDGKQIVWRHFTDAAQRNAEIWLMDADGSNKRQITSLKAVAWAPFFHPSMEWIIFASNHEDPSFDVYAIRPDGTELTRITHAQHFDGLPVVSPDGRLMLWTSNRAENRSQLFIAELLLPQRKNPPAPTKVDVPPEAAAAVKNWWSGMRDLHSAGTESLYHTVAARFRRTGLLPTNPGPVDEDTSFILGPMVAGWMPPTGEASSLLVLGASMKPDDVSCGGLAALIEGVYALKAEQGTEMNVSGIFAVGANDDAIAQLADNAQFAAQYGSKKAGKPLKVSRFVSFAGLGGLRVPRILIRGVGTSPGWRELAERLAARHPKVRFVLEDDPAGAPELKAFADAKIPCIAFGSLNEKADLDLDAEVAAENVNNTGFVIAAAIDCVRLLARGTVKLTFTPYDAAAAQAQATASQRPYLGTVPEYNSTGVTGVKLSGVRDGSPAQKAGLTGGDIIVGVGGAAIKDVNDYLKILESLKPGVETTVQFERAGKKEEVKVTPGTR
ncbi:MAG TPA: PDZ domain-containing protein [Planctomycetota bacterium]|nr:PDZ domain-containing protein [Planctomycetota bacterium]